MTKSKYVNGCLVYYDDYEHRWIKAIGPNVREWEMRFGSDFTTAKEYTNTQIGTSPTTQGITAGVRAAMLSTTTEYQGAQLQVVGTPFAIASGKPLYFGCKYTLDEATQSDFLVGLAEKDTTLLATSSAHALNFAEGIIFAKLDGVTTINAIARTGSANTSTSVSTAMDAVAHVYEFLYNGTTLSFYFDGIEVVSGIATGWPTAVLSPSIALMSGTTTALNGLISWMRCIQLT
jgi:hypothetical protein